MSSNKKDSKSASSSVPAKVLPVLPAPIAISAQLVFVTPVDDFKKIVIKEGAPTFQPVWKGSKTTASGWEKAKDSKGKTKYAQAVDDKGNFYRQLVLFSTEKELFVIRFRMPYIVQPESTEMKSGVVGAPSLKVTPKAYTVDHLQKFFTSRVVRQLAMDGTPSTDTVLAYLTTEKIYLAFEKTICWGAVNKLDPKTGLPYQYTNYKVVVPPEYNDYGLNDLDAEDMLFPNKEAYVIPSIFDAEEEVSEG